MRPAHDHAAILHVSQMGCSDIRGAERNQGSGAEEAPNGRRTSSPSARRTGARQAWSLDYTLIGPIPVVLVPPTGPAAAMPYDRSSHLVLMIVNYGYIGNPRCPQNPAEGGRIRKGIL